MNSEQLESKTTSERAHWQDVPLRVLCGLGILFALQGLLFVSMFVYGFLIYPLFGWYPGHDVVGGIVTYSIFVVLMALVLIVLHRLVNGSESRTHSALAFAAGLLLLAFPMMPILWFDDRYTIPEPSSGYVYGFDIWFWPVVMVSGFGLVFLSVFELRRPLLQQPKRVSAILYCCIAVLTIILSFWESILAYGVGHIEVRATLFSLITNVVGVTILIDTLYVYRGTLGLSGVMGRIKHQPRLTAGE